MKNKKYAYFCEKHGYIQQWEIKQEIKGFNNLLMCRYCLNNLSVIEVFDNKYKIIIYKGHNNLTSKNK